MYSIVLLAIYVFFYSKIFKNPDGKFARFLRRILPAILLLIAGYILVEKVKYGYVPSLAGLNILEALSIMQAYAALWLIHVVTSVTWILSSQNPAPWIAMPWKNKSTKLGGLILNGFLCFGVIQLLVIHMVILAVFVLGYNKFKSKRASSLVQSKSWIQPVDATH
jgi:hypothetical protein